MRRLLVTGASGNLGRVVSLLARTRWEISATYLSNPRVGGGTPLRLDLRDLERTQEALREIRPDVIVHAAVSDRSPDMENSNRLAARHIRDAAADFGVRLIALSTDLVFDGTQPPYREEAPPTPTSSYSRAKADNENCLLEYKQALVVRTSLIYDRGQDNNQAGWMLRLIAEGRKVPLFVDEIRQPIYGVDLAEAVLELAAGEIVGLLNVAGPQPLSRWDYGRALLAALGLEPDRVTQAALAAEVVPDRPRDCTLDLTRANALLATRIRPIGEALGLPPGRSEV